MSTQLDTATQRLRELILAGDFALDHKLGEIPVAERLGVSRTPARLAMAALEQEGLLRRAPNRGFTVRSFTIAEVADAIEVRGELEGMAARLVAERGLDDTSAAQLEACIDKAERLLQAGVTDIAARAAWIEMNQAFHNALLTAANNEALRSSVAHLSRIPLAGTKAIVFDQADPAHSRAQLAGAQQDHRAVYDAVCQRQGTRAAAIMREHAAKSARNKRENFAAMKAQRAIVDQPGLALVRG